MITAVIFDMDGLLIDSEPFWREAEMKVFIGYGIKLSETECRKTMGMRIDEVVKYWSLIYPEAQLNISKIANEIIQEVIALVNKKGKELPGVIKTIRFFKDKGFKIAVASASNFELINTVVDKLGIREYFDHIESAEKLKYGKPHPEVFLTTAQKLNVEPMQCLVFEDSIFGVIAARAAHMKVVAVPDKANFEHTDYAIAHLKIPSLEWFSESHFESLN